MAVKVESLAGIRVGTPVFKPQNGPVLWNRDKRLSRARRRRRIAGFQAVLEGAVWIGGSGALITIFMAALVGLR